MTCTVECTTASPEDPTVIISFRNEEVGMEWANGVSSLKLLAALIDKQRAEANHLNRNDLLDYAPFLTSAERFIERWGTGLVPTDVRRALNDIQENVGVEKTVFGSFP